MGGQDFKCEDDEKMILCACTTVEEAKAYIQRNNFTSDNVRMVKGQDYIHVKTKQDGINPWTNHKHLSLKELSLRNAL